MKKIKIVYDWFGPTGPIPNLETPNIYQLSSVLEEVQHSNRLSKKWRSSGINSNFFSTMKDVFELIPSSEIKPEDTFVYPFELHHEKPFPGYFIYDHSPGLFELSNTPGHIKHGIRSGNGYLLLEYSVEAEIYPYLYKTMHKYFSEHHIPLPKVFYQSGAPNGNELYTEWCNNENIPIDQRMNITFWDSNEWHLSRNFQGPQSNYIGNKDFKNIKTTFICLNRRYREHRINLLMYFYKNDLLKDSFFSMPAEHPDSTGQVWKDVVNRTFAQRIGLTEEDLNNIQNRLPLRVDIDTSYGDMVQDTMRKLRSWYEASLVCLVTETQGNGAVQQISEKSYKPIYYKKPFMILSTPGVLRYFRNHGYKTFSNWFPEDYDDIQNDYDRYIRVGEICKEINLWDLETKKKFFEETLEIVDYNYQRLVEVYRDKNLSKTFWSKFL